MSNDIPDKIKNEITEVIFSGRKIQAIKLYQNATGANLAEAKSFIELLTKELHEKAPEKFTASQGSGCASKVLLFLTITGIIAYFVF